MKRVLFAAVLMFSVGAGSAYALVDTAVNAVTGNISAIYNKAYMEFMKVQVVQQTQLMFQNYNESKLFYERMKAISDHKGGIAGYVEDNINQSIKEQNKETYWKVQNDFVNASGYDSFVGKTVRDTDSKIQANLDYSQKIHDLDIIRDNSLKKEVFEAAAKSDLKQEQREEIALKVGVSQLELLNSMNKTLEQVLMRQNEQAAKEWQMERQSDIENAKMKAFIDEVRTRVGKSSNKTDVYKVLGETPTH